ncbi:hypothetical protein FHT00_001847 [Sphingomonas insulae]|uniref:Uncharacterized protein n=1 Tax=Sphingomonas insulae TaxID=424800 RepID=A0ABP3T3K0_9SPHN|nr:hypothetical protein [Sphingomonas insulae]NIJ29900.1 hypothetical protein [Sphingomonas insulae]
MTDYAYSPELPWGCWMRIATGVGGVTVIDQHGRTWESLRHAFWAGRLRMSTSSPRVMNEQLELMLAAFASKRHGIVSTDERAHSVFGGDHVFMRFWWYWMYAEGLVEGGFRRDPLDADLSAEGVAVLRMLAVTRPVELNAVPVGRAAVEFLGTPGALDECDRAKFEAAEASARLLPLVIVRETAFGTAGISLLHRDPNDVIPVARTIWHIRFPDAQLRDRLFLWMADRSDRWTAWGELVLREGAPALTQHLMTLLFADRSERQPTEAPRPAGPLAIGHDGGAGRP